MYCCFLGPLPGILADKYFGRPRMLTFCFLLCFIGSCMQSLFHTLFELQTNIPGLLITTDVYYVVHITVLIILILGSSGVAALLLPYGVDQMEEAGETKMSSYFYWFYWFINLGSFMTFGRYLVYTPSISTSTYSLLSSSYLATLSAFLAVVTFRLSRSFGLLQRGPHIGSPLRKISSVTKSSLLIWYQKRRERNYLENLPILDYSKVRHFGIVKFEIVEDVKTFYRIVFVLASLLGYFSIYHLLQGYYALQAQELVLDSSPYLSNLVIGLTDNLVVIICIPFIRLVNRIPKLYRAKILYRVEFGICLSLLSVLFATLLSIGTFFSRGANSTIFPPNGGSDDNRAVDTTDHWPLFLLTLPQTVLMGLSELFAIVGAFEFVYAQSPADMKGFTYGILNTMIGLGSYLSTTLAAIIKSASGCPDRSVNSSAQQCKCCAVPHEPCLFYRNIGFVYFLIFLIFALLYSLYFLTVSIKYKRRERQEIEKWYCT